MGKNQRILSAMSTVLRSLVTDEENAGPDFLNSNRVKSKIEFISFGLNILELKNLKYDSLEWPAELWASIYLDKKNLVESLRAFNYSDPIILNKHIDEISMRSGI